MKKLILLFVFIPFFLFSQSKREQKKYDNILVLIEQGDLELAKEQSLKLLEKNKDWKKPHLLLSAIYWKKEEFDESEKELEEVNIFKNTSTDETTSSSSSTEESILNKIRNK